MLPVPGGGTSAPALPQAPCPLVADPAAAHGRAGGATFVPRPSWQVCAPATRAACARQALTGAELGPAACLLFTEPVFFSRDDTHKVDVINFAQNKATKCLQNENLVDKESAALLWDLVTLLCRQNGVGSLGLQARLLAALCSGVRRGLGWGLGSLGGLRPGRGQTGLHQGVLVAVRDA